MKFNFSVKQLLSMKQQAAKYQNNNRIVFQGIH